MSHTRPAPTSHPRWQPGAEIHGFANGYFGRDSYTCRVVEAVGPDWLVTRNIRGKAEFISLSHANQITDPDSLAYCSENGHLDGTPPASNGCDHAEKLLELRENLANRR